MSPAQRAQSGDDSVREQRAGRGRARLTWLVWLAGLFCAGSVGRGLWFEFGPPSYQPRLECDDPELNFGEGQVGEQFSHQFKIHNTGDKELVIENVTTNCGCVAALAAEARIPPGHYVMLPVRVSLEQPQERMTQTLVVHSNDPQRPTISLHVTGRVVVGKHSQAAVAAP